MPKRKRQTAAEFLTELRADPVFMAQERERERAYRRRASERRQAEAPVIAALREVGVKVDELSKLVGASDFYPRVIPILLDHLQRPYPDRVREWIARALAVPEAIQGWETLLYLFESDPDTTAMGSKWAIGCALGAAATDDVIEDVIRLVRNPEHADNRSALFVALERSTDPRSRETLEKLSADPRLEYEAKKSLKRLDRKKSGGTKPGKRVAKEPRGDLSEASMNFDSDSVELFLQQVSVLVSGFGSSEVAEVVRTIDELDVDEERELRFQVDHEGRLVPLRICVFMDDIDAPDLYFFTTSALAEEIGHLLAAFGSGTRRLT